MKNENKINDAKYKCEICGKEYSTISERAACEMNCAKKQEEEAKKAAEAKKQGEKDARFAEASAALDNAFALVNKCVEDYSTFKYTGKLKDLDMLNMDFFPSKLWHHFWF